MQHSTSFFFSTSVRILFDSGTMAWHQPLAQHQQTSCHRVHSRIHRRHHRLGVHSHKGHHIRTMAWLRP